MAVTHEQSGFTIRIADEAALSASGTRPILRTGRDELVAGKVFQTQAVRFR